MEKTYTREFFVEKGRIGGRAGKGAAKARTSEQARAAVKVRWDNARKKARNEN